MLETPPIDLSASSGLLEALNALIGVEDEFDAYTPSEAFDLAAYQSHVMKTIEVEGDVNLMLIPSLGRECRLERIRIFIAAIFLAHTNRIQLAQTATTIWVIRNETE